MKKTTLLLLTFMLTVSTTFIQADEKAWYSHSLLDKKTMKEWKKSKLVEKLSVCANFTSVEGTTSRDAILESGGDENIMKVFATNLAICIDESYVKSIDKNPIAEQAALCMMIMGYFKK